MAVSYSQEMRKADSWKLKCDTCRRMFNGPVTYRQHVQSTKHKKLHERESSLSGEVDEDQEAGLQTDESSVYAVHKFVLCCDMCHKTFTGPVPYSQHMAGELHHKHLQTKQLLEDVKQLGSELPDCQDETDLAAKLIEMTLLEVENNNVVFPQAPSDYFAFCELCMKRFTGLPPFQRHILSNGHKKRLMQKKVYDAVASFLKEKTENVSCEMRHHCSVAENLAYYGTCGKESRSDLKSGVRFTKMQQTGNSSFRVSNSFDFLSHGRRRFSSSRALNSWYNDPAFAFHNKGQDRGGKAEFESPPGRSPDGTEKREAFNSSADKSLSEVIANDPSLRSLAEAEKRESSPELAKQDSLGSDEGKGFSVTSCEVCQKSCTGPIPLQWHLASHGHQKKLKNKEFLESFASKRYSGKGPEDMAQKV